MTAGHERQRLAAERADANFDAICQAQGLRWDLDRNEWDRARRESGIVAAEDKQRQAIAAADEIARQIMQIPAATAAGLSVKLTAARWMHPDDDEARSILDSIEGDIAAMA